MPRGQRAAAPRNDQAQSRAVAVFDPDDAARKLTAAVRAREGQFAALLALDPGTSVGRRSLDRFVTVALNAAISDRKVLEADLLSVVSAIRQAAELNLEPSGILGDGFLNARWNRDAEKKLAVFEPMYRGLAKLARRSPSVAAIDWQIVYEQDHFRLVLGSDPRIEHEPSLAERGAIRGAYAYARLTSGELVVQWMTTAEILKVRDQASRSYQESGDGSLWIKWPEQMFLKTVVKRLCKKLPLDSVAQMAVALDDQQETPIRVSAPAAPLTGLRARLGVPAIEPGESVQNGSGDAETAEAGSDTARAENAAQGPSTAATEPTEGQAVELCGDRNPYVDDDDPKADERACAEPKGHKAGKTHGGHKSTDNETW
jgi:recombination protein RecT